MRNRKRPADYALVPNAACWQPPIRHRHTPPRLRHLAPSAVYVLGGILIAARAALAPQRHGEAMALGSLAIRQEVETSRRFFDSMASGGQVWGKPTKGRAIKHVGSVEYRAAKAAARQRAPDEVTFDMTVRRLLRFAGLAIDSQNYRAVEAALNRLCRPVGAGSAAMPAPLRSWERLPGGTLRLRVDGAWVPAKKFKRVLWPPPKRSPAALAFHLLLCVLDTRPTNKAEVSAGWVAARLGLDPRATAGARNRAINAAFGIINAHLRDLPDAVVRRLWRRGATPPMEYVCEPITGGKIRVVAVPRPTVYVKATATTRPVGKKRSLRRTPSRREVGVLAPDRRDQVGDFASESRRVWGTLHPGVGDLAPPEPQEPPALQGFSRDLRGPYEKERARRSLVGEDY